MAIETVNEFVDALREGHLLSETQWQQLAPKIQDGATDVRALARELITLGWLTPFQVNRLVQKRGHEIIMDEYLLLEQLGEGGMGTVYKARHRLMNRLVALKVIRKTMVANQDSIKRFRREIEAVAKLAHPNVVMAYDAKEGAGNQFFVMEYVEGTNLTNLVKRQGPVSVALACEIIRQAALGLQHAHEHGLVHRDIKPSNLLLSARDNTVKVLDLGLARLQAEDGQANSELTQTGMVMGTPDFMAPEQATNPHDVDIRADIYSLGATLFFLLTGKPLFPGGNLDQKLSWHMKAQPPALDKACPEAPPALAEVLGRMLAKRPAERFATPAEVAAALAPFAQGNSSLYNQTVTIGVASPEAPTVSSSVTAVPPQAKTLPLPWVWLGGGLLGFVVLLLLLVRLFPTPSFDGFATKKDDKPPPPTLAVNPAPRIFFRFSKDMEIGLWVEHPDGASYSLTYDTFALPIKAGRPVSATNTVVRIDEQNVIFGSDAGVWEEKEGPLPLGPDGKARHGRQGVWRYRNIAITQTVAAVPSQNKDADDQHLLDTCLISYRIENRDSEPHLVGIRCFVDVIVGKKDNPPFQLPGQKEFIKEPTDFPTPAKVPAYIKALERADQFNPGLTAYVALKMTGKLEPPGRFSVIDFNPTITWDVPLRNLNRPADESPDTGIVLYWQPTFMQPGGRRDVGYAYGIGLPVDVDVRASP